MIETSIARPARGVSEATPFSIASPITGYQGQGFYLTWDVDNNGSSPLRVNGLILTLDYDNTTVGYVDSLPPGQGQEESEWIHLPSDESLGNHPFTVTADFQRYDNNTGAWLTRSDSPRILTGDLRVLPAAATPAVSTIVAGTMLPISFVFLASGVAIGLYPFMRKPKTIPPQDPSISRTEPARTRIHPLQAAGLATIPAFFIWYLSQIGPAIIWYQGLALGLLFALSTIAAITVFKNGYSPRSQLSVLLISLGATVASTLDTQLYHPAGSCGPGQFRAGYPFPWATITFPIPPPGPITYCLFYYRSPILATAAIFFPLDAAFYAAITFAILELFRASRRKAAGSNLIPHNGSSIGKSQVSPAGSRSGWTPLPSKFAKSKVLKGMRVVALFTLLLLSIQLAAVVSSNNILDQRPSIPVNDSNQSLSYNVSIFDGNPTCSPVTPPNCGFNPQSITIKRDSTIVWTNNGLDAHDLASCSVPNNPYPFVCPIRDDPSLPSFNSGIITTNGTISYKFTEPGTYYYFSPIHPWMSGVVTVGQPHPVHPIQVENFTFQDVTNQVHSTSLCCWIGQTLHITNTLFNGYVTVGGNGISTYSATNNIYPPNIADSGYLTGEAWDGIELLLVGQHYSPQGGDLMLSYNPASGALTDLSSLFPANLARNATLVGAVTDGSTFYILSLVGEEVFPGDTASVRLYTYTNSTNTLTDITGLLPANFKTATNNPQEIVWTTHGLFLILTTSAGTIFGTLQHQTFTDLTSLLPQGFHLSSSNGFLTPNRFQYSTLLQGDDLFLTGLTGQNTMALLRVNLVDSTATDYSPLLVSIPGSPLELAYLDGQLYLAGFKSTQASPQPLLIEFDPRTTTATDISSMIPTTFGIVGGLATDGEALFLAGGLFLNVHYGILVPDPQGGSNLQATN